MKKILIASYDLQVGGVERSLISLLEHFDYNNYNVDLLLYNHSGDFLSYLTENVNLLPEDLELSSLRKPISTVFKEKQYLLGVTRLIAKIKSYFSKKSGESVVQMQDMWRFSLPFIKKNKKSYDVAISYLWPHDYVAYKVKANKKIAWIHTDYSKIETDIKRDLKVWSKFDHIVSISNDVTQSFLKKYPTLKSKIIMIENIISPRFIQEQSLIEVSDFDPKMFNIVSVGRLAYAKGYDNAVKSMKKLYDKGLKDIKWYIVGYGAEEKKIKSLIKENNLEEVFVLLGKKINPYPYVRACDLYVQPSRYEGKAVTVSEAKILGKPVLLTNYDTAPSQLQHGIDGYITELSIDGIVDGVEKLYNDSQLRKSLATKCQETNYSNVEELQKLYYLF